MGMQEFNDKINTALAKLQKQIKEGINFVVGRLKNYKNITLGEQIAYPCIGAGILLIFISIILFIL